MVIKEFDHVILKKANNMKVVQIISKRPLALWKEKFNVDGVIGHAFGSSFVLQNGQLVKVNMAEIDCDIIDKDDESADIVTKDNRNLVDSSNNQQLTNEEIINLRKQGITGGEIVEQIVENSATFAAKNEFSQRKYIKRKMKKHVSVFTVLKPNMRNLIEMYHNRGPAKICNLRMDSLSQILAQSNVRSGSRLMVVDTCQGLVLGALLERMNGVGSIVHLYTGSAPSRSTVTDGFHFQESFLTGLHSFPLEQVSTLRRSNGSAESQAVVDASISVMESSAPLSDIPSLADCYTSSEVGVQDGEQKASVDIKVSSDEQPTPQFQSNQAENSKCGEQRKRSRRYEKPEEREKQRAVRLEQIQQAKSIIEDGGMDGLIVAGRMFPTPIVLSLLDFIKPSRPIIVFCPNVEPLTDCFMTLRESGRVLMMNLSETWLRGYQILPERTHPVIKMSGSGGFLLTATVVNN